MIRICGVAGSWIGNLPHLADARLQGPGSKPVLHGKMVKSVAIWMLLRFFNMLGEVICWKPAQTYPGLVDMPPILGRCDQTFPGTRRGGLISGELRYTQVRRGDNSQEYGFWSCTSTVLLRQYYVVCCCGTSRKQFARTLLIKWGWGGIRGNWTETCVDFGRRWGHGGGAASVSILPQPTRAMIISHDHLHLHDHLQRHIDCSCNAIGKYQLCCHVRSSPDASYQTHAEMRAKPLNVSICCTQSLRPAQGAAMVPPSSICLCGL